ncbi:MAG: D-glycerate dehydrogenase [Gaiellaceae bacterium MAG52_C11]|nr:D-glycerate dehydrogenase [Candidatus Gaiellasilicea maunaloa]
MFDLDLHDSDAPLPRDLFLARADGVSGILATLADRVDSDLLQRAGPNLRVVANFAAGLDNVDVEAATARGVLVTNTPGAVTRPTAELAVALTLTLLRRVAEGDRLLRGRVAWEWAPMWMLGSGLKGRTLGIVGFGRIGKDAARLASAFGMNVISTRRPGQLADPASVPLDELLRSADVVSLHCPLTVETKHLIGSRELSLMRPTAILVNTSRGPVVDERALVAALQEQRIAGAALDVFEFEPAVTAELLELENVVLTPHLGGATWEAREEMGAQCAEALEAVLIEGVQPKYAVNGGRSGRA